MRPKEVTNQGPKICCKIIEKGGVTLEQQLRKSNPWAGARCGRQQCFPCMSNKGGNCSRDGVTYSLVCEECGENVVEYTGDTGRNGFTRGTEHLEYLATKNEDKSVLRLH